MSVQAGAAGGGVPRLIVHVTSVEGRGAIDLPLVDRDRPSACCDRSLAPRAPSLPRHDDRFSRHRHPRQALARLSCGAIRLIQFPVIRCHLVVAPGTVCRTQPRRHSTVSPTTPHRSIIVLRYREERQAMKRADRVPAVALMRLRSPSSWQPLPCSRDTGCRPSSPR